MALCTLTHTYAVQSARMPETMFASPRIPLPKWTTLRLMVQSPRLRMPLSPSRTSRYVPCTACSTAAKVENPSAGSSTTSRTPGLKSDGIVVIVCPS